MAILQCRKSSFRDCLCKINTICISQDPGKDSTLNLEKKGELNKGLFVKERFVQNEEGSCSKADGNREGAIHTLQGERAGGRAVALDLRGATVLTEENS